MVSIMGADEAGHIRSQGINNHDFDLVKTR